MMAGHSKGKCPIRWDINFHDARKECSGGGGGGGEQWRKFVIWILLLVGPCYWWIYFLWNICHCISSAWLWEWLRIGGGGGGGEIWRIRISDPISGLLLESLTTASSSQMLPAQEAQLSRTLFDILYVFDPTEFSPLLIPPQIRIRKLRIVHLFLE